MLEALRVKGVKQQVDAGLKELDEGLHHEEVEKRLSRWLKR